MDQKFSNVGERILTRLKELGLKQADICKATGISSNAISQYCTGKRIPDTSSLYQIADILETSMEWILTGKNTTDENTSNESLSCDGIPLTQVEEELVAIFRILPESHRKELFDLAYFKYKHIVEAGKESIYSAYIDAQRKSAPADDESHLGTA